ncbi:MAG TPA: Hpt domain-containing protein [Gammaproteobacteria bacterium]|nr:Hpt domain-containing protein [Gammaproteobacteria bacterium]
MTSKSLDDLVLVVQALRPEIRAMLSEDLPEDCTRAEQAYSRRDWAVMQSHVHRVNGSASFCKLGALRAVCAEIETGLKQKDPPNEVTMQGFSREIRRVLAALKDLERE